MGVQLVREVRIDEVELMLIDIKIKGTPWQRAGEDFFHDPTDKHFAKGRLDGWR